MPRYIVKTNKDEDFYVVWSEIVDSPLYWGTRDQLVAQYDLADPERFERADKAGTSSFNPAFGGWDDSGFIYEQIGWLPRHNLKALCLWLEDHGEDINPDHLLESLED